MTQASGHTLLSQADCARMSARVTCGADAERTARVGPLSETPVGYLPVSSTDDVDQAFARARQAQVAWAQRPAGERAAFLNKLHDLVLKHQDELLDLMQYESGKSRAHAFDEIMDVACVCRHYARKGPKYLAPQRVLGAIPGLTQTSIHYRPKGVVGVVAPWNYPLSMSITDALPALVAGNAVVLRPDEKTSFTAIRVVELCDEAGLDRELLQVVLGDGASIGAAVLAQADYVMFTGSTATGRRIARDAGERLVGASLELGGKNPMYVAADADLDQAAECAVRSSFASAGQLCISIERLYVHEDVVEEFTRLFVARVKALKLGATIGWGPDVGSLISAQQLKTVESHVDDAVAHGAEVLAGGRARPDLGPYFYEPTVLRGVTQEMQCFGSETFGPLVSIYPVADDAEAIRLANDTPFGLNASVWTKDLAKGREIAAQIKAGTVNVNEGFAAAWASNGAPMGGMKSSGLGRRHGAEGIRKYTDIQNVAVQRAFGFARPRGVSQKQYAKAFTLSLKAMKKAGLS